jgi:uncharacterized membrane protein YoaK (UPF0700 family)
MIYRSIAVLRSLASVERTQVANTRLASVLAFIAGSINAGGYLAVRQYTSHMSGIVSAIADNFALADYPLILAGMAAVLSFVAGAMCCAIVINWGDRSLLHSRYALALVIESALLVVFSYRGRAWDQHQLIAIPVTVSLLCFVMGFQNAIITRISNAEIRTTHVTGMITDIGIELGKLVYVNLSPSDDMRPKVLANRHKTRILAQLVGLFFLGGMSGAFGFHQFGFGFALPLAGMLILMALLPIVDDVSKRLHSADP